MVNVEISYENRYLESVLVDGNEMEISEIQEDPIEVWFQKKSGRSNWKGLIEQIYEFVGNEDSELIFEFFGTDEDKKIFDSMLSKKGISEAETILQSNEAKKMKAFQAAEVCNKREEFEKAFSLYKEAAEGGIIQAWDKLGEYYQNGIGTKKSEKDAFEAYKKGAAYGDENAQFHLAKCYYFGSGMEKTFLMR